MNHSIKELAVGNPHSPHSPSASPDRTCPISVLAPSLEGRGRLGRGGATRWLPVLQVWDALLWFHLASHRCVCVCVPCISAVMDVQVCVCMPCISAVIGVQVCACVPCISASSEALGFHSSPARPLPVGAPVLSDSGDFPALPLPFFSAPPPQLSQPDVGVGGQGGRERPTTFSGQPLTPDTLPSVLGLLGIHPQRCSWD